MVQGQQKNNGVVFTMHDYGTGETRVKDKERNASGAEMLR